MVKILRWFPWRYVVSRVARARGLIDPIKVLSRLESFAQPLEVKEPLELLRAGMVFHARGLLNTHAIQHNLDWVWPYWVERQYDPADVSFIPRAFSITHVNLTHRNWTAVGVPDVDQLPIVDPCGLVTPFWDGWSLDAWILPDEGVGHEADDSRHLYPSRLRPGRGVDQELRCCDERGDCAMAVVTRCRRDGLELVSRAEAAGRDGGSKGDGRAELLLTHSATADAPAWLVVALRPYNPEGVSFVHRLALDRDPEGDAVGWTVDRKRPVRFSEPIDRHRFSTYQDGDVHAALPGPGERESVQCEVGMATAAALFRLEPGVPRTIQVTMPLQSRAEIGPLRKLRRSVPRTDCDTWADALAPSCRLETPHRRTRFLWEAALRSLVLHSPEEVYPGPYTYKRFWFRDAAFILHGLACAGLFDRVERTLALFPSRQTRKGFFLSQEGEWDSNGEALWILDRFVALSGRDLPVGPKGDGAGAWRHPVEKGAQWIVDKRGSSEGAELHTGLLPPGFSAEHLGPNDYYYWDDFWGVAGLHAGADLLERMGHDGAARRFRLEADLFRADLERSLDRVSERLPDRWRPAIPASPYRRMDSGAIGSLAFSYPLALCAPDDPRLLGTADYLVERCLVDGGFFQDVIHSGINPYLTLHLAQVLLRAGDARGVGLMHSVARLASPTGQWPEAIHPRTGGGCMGDGHHVWAAAEWLLAVRDALVREEPDRLVLGTGLAAEWLVGEDGRDGELAFGPAPTPWGPISVRFAPRGDEVEVTWSGEWRGDPPPVEVRLPGMPLAAAVRGDGWARVPRPAPVSELVPEGARPERIHRDEHPVGQPAGAS